MDEMILNGYGAINVFILGLLVGLGVAWALDKRLKKRV